MNELNKTVTYLLPLLGENSSFYMPYLKNAYCGFKEIVSEKPVLVLVLKDSKTSEEFIEKLKTNKYFKWTQFINNLEVFTFELDDYGGAIIEIFLKGSYSKLPHEYKEQISNFHKLKADSVILKILNKDPSLKLEIEKDLGVKINDQELSSIPDQSKEFLEIELHNFYSV